jgi:rubredoxin
MKCPLCGYQFQEESGKVACKGCPLAGSCHMVRCPNCGYDTPVEPKLVKAFKAWRRRQNGTRGKS